MNSNWRDGFLVVGNHLDLDFLNTRPVMDGNPVELLPDCAALARWLKAAGLVPAREAKRLERGWSTRAAFEAELRELLEFRERLRQAVFQIEAGKAPSPAFIARVNDLLSAYPHIDQVIQTDSGPRRGKRFAPQTPLDVFAPVLDSVASLLTLTDKSRLRKCGNCVLHFYDTSKKGTRYWCSMNLCGNRSKVAAYARRKRAELSGD
ncbi:MAG TPA: ABATE domain-containing protein [Bryobacteraceae bacterium]|jgi:predicted RNA-binding Zn ribbon-like protein|nr:ABATE domain-containing protein [Bryobacteraceae bacterium]